MRELGCVLTILCLVFALIFVWLGYITTFEASGPMAGMESTPKEGWDYWIQKKFWSDFWTFSLWVCFGVASVALPMIATVRSRLPITERRMTDKVLLCMTGLYLIPVLFFVFTRLKAKSLMTVFPMPLLLGAIYSFGVFSLRVRHPFSGAHERLD